MTVTTPSPRAAASFGRPRRRSRTASRLLTRIGPLIPAVVLMAVFFAGPIFWAVRTSMTNQALTGSRAVTPEFVGFDNLVRVFTEQSSIDAIVRTVIFVLLSVAGQNILGLLLALLMRNRNAIVRGFAATAVVGAWVIPEIVAAFTWYAFLSPTAGSLNEILTAIGLPAQSWLVDSPMI